MPRKPTPTSPRDPADLLAALERLIARRLRRVIGRGPEAALVRALRAQVAAHARTVH